MLLKNLMDGLKTERVDGDRNREITAIVYDSTRVVPGALFVALQGKVTDGRRFIRDAAARGAVAVMGHDLEGYVTEGMTRVEVNDPRRAMARLAASFHGNPTNRIRLTGVTGTNGKTTTAYLLRAIWEADARAAGLIGTIEYATGGRVLRASRTTPESPDIQALLEEMVRGGLSDAVMEVSSHGLHQGRVEGCAFSCAVYTRVTRDHLDYHGSLDEYRAAKAALVDYVVPDGTVIINGEDRPTAKAVRARATTRRVISYGMYDDADLSGAELTNTVEGIRMKLRWGGAVFSLKSPLIGAFNAENILAAAAAAIASGVEPDGIVSGIERMSGVPGRFQRVDGGAPFAVIVDYAHTDDALEKVLANVRKLTGGRVICVFGCGGDRDRTKRAPMGSAADRWSDLPIVTSDNPRNEDPANIVTDILAGMVSGRAIVLEDRREAIFEAVRVAQPGDIVVLAGKGHETEQQIGATSHHFSDQETAREALRERFGAVGDLRG